MDSNDDLVQSADKDGQENAIGAAPADAGNSQNEVSGGDSLQIEEGTTPCGEGAGNEVVENDIMENGTPTNTRVGDLNDDGEKPQAKGDGRSPPFNRRPPHATSSFGKTFPAKPPMSLSPTRKPLTPTNSFGDKTSSVTRQVSRSPPGRNHSGSRRQPTALSPTIAVSPSTDNVTDLSSNPLQTDSELKAMIEEQLEAVISYRSLKLWKSSFLNRFDTFLTEEGAPLAKKAYTDFGSSVQSFVKYVNQVQSNVERGDLSVDRTTVRGRNSLNEMNKFLVQVMDKERDLIPASSKDEKTTGYTKFHLGAFLVRDGFRAHQKLNNCSETLMNLKNNTDLKHIADRQQLDEISKLEKQLARFRDIMHDLGLFNVMLKCLQYGEPEDELIFVDLKTGAIGAITLKSCLDRLVVHKEEEGNSAAFREAITDEEDRQAVLDLVTEVLISKNL